MSARCLAFFGTIETRLLKLLEKTNKTLGNFFTWNLIRKDEQSLRIRYGMAAGWTSIIMTVVLFAVRIVMGLQSGSVSVIADAFHLLSHLANSVILLVTIWVASKPATSRTPFGHGRMEHVGPLIMSVFLFVSGIDIGERSIHQALHPIKIHYWQALPLILLATVFAKAWMGQFVRYLGECTGSKVILVNAGHQRVEAVSTLTVIAGILMGHFFQLNQADGYIGIALSAWLLYLGYTHAHHAIIPLLGSAPDRDMIHRIRESARSVEGIEDVHEIVIHDYGSLFFISLHGEIPEIYGPSRIHEISEQCEKKIRDQFGGEVVCHSDPLLEKTPEIEAIEKRFREVVTQDSRITGYHDFRVISESEQRIIIVADIDVDEEVPGAEFEEIAAGLENRAMKVLSNLAYCSFYVTPKFAY